MSVETAAERYASALFALAREQGTTAQIDAEVMKAAKVARDEPILVRALVGPDIPDSVKRSILKEVFGHIISPLALNFLHLLVDRQRFGALPEIARRFRELVQDAEGQIQVDVETAVELTAELQRAVEAQVRRHTGRSPVVRWHVQPEHLGGVVVRIKDNIIDYSLRSQLHQLRDRLLHAQN